MDFQEIEALVKILHDSPTLTEVEVKHGGVGVRLRRPLPAAPQASASQGQGHAAAPAPTETGRAAAPKPIPVSTAALVTITSPLVGVFRARRGNPVTPGDQVSVNEQLGQIEAMRLMSDCVATTAGRIQAILVEEGRPVEYGQPLFEIAPEAIA